MIEILRYNIKEVYHCLDEDLLRIEVETENDERKFVDFSYNSLISELLDILE